MSKQEFISEFVNRGFGSVEDAKRTREAFIKAAMQGYISAGSMGMPQPEDIANMAVLTADATLKAMQR